MGKEHLWAKGDSYFRRAIQRRVPGDLQVRPLLAQPVKSRRSTRRDADHETVGLQQRNLAHRCHRGVPSNEGVSSKTNWTAKAGQDSRTASVASHSIAKVGANGAVP
ncbi:MAG: hypothetical protein ABI651_20845 [Verrucomicrobiota bacterium]